MGNYFERGDVSFAKLTCHVSEVISYRNPKRTVRAGALITAIAFGANIPGE